MDFFDMGKIDFDAYIDKHGDKGDLKSVSVRLNSEFADFLNDLSKSIGMTRQPFMSSVIENYYYDAIISYISGYSAYMDGFDFDKFFVDMNQDSEIFKSFKVKFDKQKALDSVRDNAYRVYEGQDKKDFFDNYIKPDLDSRFGYPPITSFDLGSPKSDEKQNGDD